MSRLRRPLGVLVAGLTMASAVSAGERLGTVRFPISCDSEARPAFERAVALLHSFWIDAALRSFSGVAQADPGCAMAHWGIAMTLVHAPPEPALLARGWEAVERARVAEAGTARERDYIAAIREFYEDWNTRDPRTRALAYERAMRGLVARYSDDPEAAIFHALALSATALPSDRTHGVQLEVAAILERQFAERPGHPGVAHYLIHAYDSADLAARGLAAARRYVRIAPSAPHALHMPSHLFTRSGLWEESIASNRASLAASRHAHDRLHALDYLVYAHLQLAQDREAERILADLRALAVPLAQDFVIAHALAAIPARYAVERGRWGEAAALESAPRQFPWARFPQAESLTVFARGLGAARSRDLATAALAVARLAELRDVLRASGQADWAEQAEVQGLAVAGWAAFAGRRPEEAVRFLRMAADREDATEKHPVTPGRIAPARELFGELLLELGQSAEALRAFESTHRAEPNRFRGLYGAVRAAELAGDREAARVYAARLVTLAERADTARPELAHARALLETSRSATGGPS